MTGSSGGGRADGVGEGGAVGGAVDVFAVEDRLVGGDEGAQVLALVVGRALLVERPVAVVDELGELPELVLEVYFTTALTWPPVGG